jgi:hypothetical protein
MDTIPTGYFDQFADTVQNSNCLFTSDEAELIAPPPRAARCP